jgi:hypothetical protein
MSTVNIPYTATIVSKDDVAKTMEVQYASQGLATLTIGVTPRKVRPLTVSLQTLPLSSSGRTLNWLS